MSETSKPIPANSAPKIPEGPLVSALAGMPQARAWAEALVDDLALYKAGRLAWSDVDPGCVLHGPPGTGKTTLARAIAATAKLPLLATSYADWTRGGRYGIDIINSMRAVFQTARENAPCVVAIDELDSMPSRSTLPPEHPVTHSIVNALLEQLDGLNRRPGVVVIGTCNHPDRLDEALVRAGRLGRSIHIPLPPLESLPKILAYHLGSDAGAFGDLSNVAVMCVGMSGADVEQLVRDARQRARRAARSLRGTDLTAVLEARYGSCDGETVRRIAVHEAGHAVAAYRLALSDTITVTLIPGRSSSGTVSINPRGQVLTRPMVEDRLVMLLAGRAAELAMLDGPSAGAGGDKESDLARATKLALLAVGSFGLSTRDSLLWHGPADGGDALHLNRYPAAIVDEVRQMIDDANERALMLMRSESRLVDELAALLIERRAVTSNDIAGLARKLDSGAMKRDPNEPTRDGFENFERTLQELDNPAPRKLASMDWIVEELALFPSTAQRFASSEIDREIRATHAKLGLDAITRRRGSRPQSGLRRNRSV